MYHTVKTRLRATPIKRSIDVAHVTATQRVTKKNEHYKDGHDYESQTLLIN